MTIRDMHYDFKQKLNKIDSQKYRNLKVPEIDWKLNEALEIFIKLVAEPRLRQSFGFEINQRTIDDIRPLVVNQSFVNGNCISTAQFDDVSSVVVLPDDYLHHISSNVIATKASCENKKIRTTVREHDDEYENDTFESSSFEWRVVNIRFIKEGIRIFTGGDFTVSHLCLDYIKKPVLIHNAQDYVGGTYTLNGVALTGSQDCELPDSTHRTIVDIAVLITSGDLQFPDYNIKSEKLRLSN